MGKKKQKKHHISGVFQLYLYQTSLLDNRCGHSAKDKKGKKLNFFSTFNMTILQKQ